MTTTDLPITDDLLDLLEAVTEIRVRNPELRASVLSALRLASSNGLIACGRLYSLRFDGSVSTIIAHGEATQAEDADRELVEQIVNDRQVTSADGVTAYPLGGERRLYGVILIEGADDRTGRLLADLFVQWHAVADFLNTEKAELIDENFQLREEIRRQFDDKNIIGVSGSFRRVVDNAMRVAPSSATVLVHGETGTGKELVARLIHEHSPRSNAPFISVNCGALTETLLETELFGHVKGAFTGAVADHKGRFEAAHGGTIFLDEIGEVSPGMQVRLLRVLQEMEVVRVGDHKARKLDVRVVAATNRDLEEEVREGRFRADLFYRLNVVHLSIPPLRNRPEDIAPLVEHFLSTFCQRNFKYIDHVARDTLDIMRAYHWPGNVRELENCIEKMVVMAPGNELTADLLPMAVVAYISTETEPSAPAAETFEALLTRYLRSEIHGSIERGGGDLYNTVRAKWERYLFEQVLDTCRNNKSKAARMLGITRNTLNARLGDLCEVKREWTVE